MTKTRRPRNRYSPEQQQEDRSVHQFNDRMVAFGWKPEREVRDIGEDVAVRIITDSLPTGVPFYVQLKSVTDLKAKPKKDFVSYRLEVDDLLRWENSPIPVALVIWDINELEGRWEIIPALVDQLDATRPDWRNQQTTTVYLPWKNATDDSGLNRLRAAIGHKLLPLISVGRNIEVGFNVVIPDTDDATEIRRDVEMLIREGTPISIDGQYIQDLKFSDWWAEWFVNDETHFDYIRLAPVPNPEPEPVSILLLSNSGDSIEFAGIELKRVRGGTHLVELNNEHQNTPIIFNIHLPGRDADHRSINVTFKVNHVGYSASETRQIIRFLQGLKHGGRFEIILHKHNGKSLSMDFPALSDEELVDVLVDPEYAQLVETLYWLEAKLGRRIRLPDGDIHIKDAEALNELKEIVEQGFIVMNAKSLSVTAKGVHVAKNLLEAHRESESGSAIKVVQTTDAAQVVLFGEEIPVGPMTRTTIGELDISDSELKAYVQQGDNEAEFKVILNKAQIIERFDHWQPDSNLEMQQLSQGRTVEGD